jgi:hypothetical protein
MDLDRRHQLRLGLLSCSVALLGGLLLCAPAARAALGSSAASIAADRDQLRASVRVTSHALYEVHELMLPNGVSVREYRVPDGIVFAIAWSGPAKPDLSQALGAYFPGYVEAAKANTDGHNHMSARRADLVMTSTGRMRDFAGHAYLASAVPAGVSIDELR